MRPWHDNNRPPFVSPVIVPAQRSNMYSHPPRKVLLAALVPVLLFLIAQGRQLFRIPAYVEPDSSSQTSSPSHPRRLAVVTFVDSKDYMLWGVYSIHKQLTKLKMTPEVRHVALIAKDMNKRHKMLIEGWLGPENVRVIDKTVVRKKCDSSLWGAVFSKLEFFNMTDFDKVIALDNDIFIRRNIMHWFDYPTPAATGDKGTIEWNSGAMVIEPSTRLYESLLDYLPRSRRYKPEWDEGEDTWNSGDGQQGFLSSFFTSNATDDKMFTMDYVSSVRSSDLNDWFPNHYFWHHRNDAIETVHLTLHKPWKEKTDPSRREICDVLREWTESVADAPADELPKLPDYLRNCPPENRLPRETSSTAI